MPAICKENTQPEHHPAMLWTWTLCSMVSEGGWCGEHAMFHKAVSFIAPNGDKVTNDTHIIFCTWQNGKVSSHPNGSFDSYHLLIHCILAINWTGERDNCTSGWCTTTCNTYCHSAPWISAFSPSDISSSLSQAYWRQHCAWPLGEWSVIIGLHLSMLKIHVRMWFVVSTSNMIVTSQCTQTQQTHQRQERTKSAKLHTYIVHPLTSNYILNAYSMHNYQHILFTIPSQCYI